MGNNNKTRSAQGMQAVHMSANADKALDNKWAHFEQSLKLKPFREKTQSVPKSLVAGKQKQTEHGRNMGKSSLPLGNVRR